MKVLFVCAGNHGRSQLAEAIFNNLSGGKHLATSAGTKVITEEKNDEGKRVSDSTIIAVMKELGIDVSGKTRNQLTPKMLEDADRVVIMAEPETFPEYLKPNEKTIFWEVIDPFKESLEFTRDLRNRIQVLVGNFFKTLN